MRVRSVKELGALVREHRNNLGWSQEKLAARVGVQRLWVSQFEGGKTTAHIGLVMRTLRVLDVALSVGDERSAFKYSDSQSPSQSAGLPIIDLGAIIRENIDEP